MEQSREWELIANGVNIQIEYPQCGTITVWLEDYHIDEDQNEIDLKIPQVRELTKALTTFLEWYDKKNSR